MSELAGVRLDAFTYNDFELMLKALKALEVEASSNFVMKSMLGTMLSRSKEEAEERLQKAQKEANDQEYKQRALQEDISLLRAKLILARKDLDSEEADRAFKAAQERGSAGVDL